MKKVLLSAVALMALVSSYAGGNGVKGHDEPVQGGFFLNGHIGFYGKNYLMDDVSADVVPDEFKISMIGSGIEIGNMFQLTDFSSGGEMGLGIRAIWFGAGAAVGSNDFVDVFSFNLALVSPGVYFTKAIGDNALDAYINAVPTFIGIGSTTKEGEQVGDVEVGAGVPFKLGASFRTGIFSTGLEYNLGSVTFSGEEGFENGDFSVRTNHLRILVGMKF